MKYFLSFFLITLAVASSALAREESLLARVTVYWATGGAGSDAHTRDHKCSTGERLRAGHCAVDPKKIPYGSKVIFPDATCVAVDTGGDVINRKAARRSGQTSRERSALVIDRFFETKDQAMAWSNANPHFMTVRVIPPGPQLARANTTPSVPKPNIPRVARKDSASVKKAVAAVPPVADAAIIGAVDVPQSKLVAANVDRGAMQLSRRF